MAEQEISTLNPTGVAGQGFTYKKDMDDMFTASKDHMNACFAAQKKDMGDMLTEHMNGVQKCFKDLNDRMDDIESSWAVAQDGPSPVTKSKTLEPKEDKSEKEKALNDLMKCLNELKDDIRKA